MIVKYVTVKWRCMAKRDSEIILFLHRTRSHIPFLHKINTDKKEQIYKLDTCSNELFISGL